MNNKLNLLQVIRGLAAVLVVFHHVSSSSEVYFNAVWFDDFFNSSRALDIFFVLSGFIITYIHFSDLQKKTNVKAFFIKRFNRIYPVFWIVSLVYLAFYIAVKTYSVHDLSSGFMIKSFFANRHQNTTDGESSLDVALRSNILFGIRYLHCLWAQSC